MLSLKNLKHKYRFGAVSFSDITFSVEKNEILYVYGKTESGKTSLLNAISGIIAPCEGSISLNGKDITHSEIKERNVSYLHSDLALFNNKSVKYNLEYPLKIRGEREEIINERISNVISEFDLEDIIQTKIKKLPDEIKFKIAFSRFFLRKSDVYLLDDPFKTIEEYHNYLPYIEKLNTDSVVILATSLKEIIPEIKNKIMIMNYGIRHQVGSYYDICENPLSCFVYKTIFDTCNIFIGKILSIDNSQIVLSFNDKIIELNKKYLFNDIFIDKNVIVATNKDNNVKIYDIKSEKLIYFGKID